MEDEKIVQLIWDRNENGINELSEKYDRYCFCISERIVHDEEDAKECVNFDLVCGLAQVHIVLHIGAIGDHDPHG